MCGITGIVPKGSFTETAVVLRRMNNRLKHRGPDDAGFWLGDVQNSRSFADPESHPDIRAILPLLDTALTQKVGLGHRRLSIIDLSPAGHQPMLSQDERFVLSYNGELYNYIELRAELTSKGHTFKTAGDAEVLIAAWQHWGPDALSHFEGMWAFALYDRQEHKLWLVRDRTGVKPLFYLTTKEAFLFASEPKALLASGLYTPVLNEGAAYSFLVHAALDEDQGYLLEDIQELAAGHWLQYDLRTDDMEVKRYHQPIWNDDLKAASTFQRELTVTTIREQLTRSVNLRLRSDVKVGASLSGGLDSAALAALAAKETGFPLFTAVYDGFPENEGHYARAVAELLKADWQPVEVNAAGIADRLEDMVNIQDGPVLALSTFAQLLICETAHRQGVTILLDGQGGDELFTGYDRYWLSFYQQALQTGNLSVLGAAFQQAGKQKLLFNSMSSLFLNPLLGNRRLGAFFRNTLAQRKPELAYLDKNYAEQHFALSMAYVSRGVASSVNAQQARELYGYDLKNLLRWGDRNSMSAAIENRAPFADDPQLAQLLLSIPAAEKLDIQGVSKKLLREAMQGKLPEMVLHRQDKQGFTTPQLPWMKTLWPVWKQYLEYLPGWVNKGAIHRDANRLLEDARGVAFLLRAVSLGAWLKNLQAHTKSL